MSAVASSGALATTTVNTAPIQEQVDYVIEELLASLPKPSSLSALQRRGIIARYTSVLEGNFIYWMTGALMSAKTEEARTIILDNLQEEIRDAHPLMMRRFAIAAQAVPTDTDALAVTRDVTSMRLFIGRLQPVPTLTTMAFFEGFIQRFMQYLGELAQLQGSSEMEYTDVHGVCDIAHTAGLYKALQLEIDHAGGTPKDAELYEGVHGLRTLVQTIIAG